MKEESETKSTSIGARLKAERTRLGATQDDWSDLAEVSRRALIQWEKDATSVNAAALARFAAAGANVGYIVTGAKGQVPFTSHVLAANGGYGALTLKAADAEFCVVPRFEVKVSAGAGRDTLGAEQKIGAFAFDTSWMRKTLGRSGDGFASVQVSGDSMQPTLLAGDEIIIDLHIKRVDVSGIYVIALRGDLLVKRIQRKLDGSLVVKSDNTAYEPEHIAAPQADEFVVVGRLVWPRVR